MRWEKIKNSGKFLRRHAFYFVMILCLSVIGLTGYVTSKIPKPSLEMPEINYNISTVLESEVPSAVPSDPAPIAVPSEVSSEARSVEIRTEVEEELQRAVPAMSNTSPEFEVSESTTVEAEVVEPPKRLIKPIKGAVFQAFSGDNLVFSRTMGDWRVHNGIDIAGQVGETVVASAKGVVEYVLDDQLMGRTIVIDHGSNFRTIYSNLAVSDDIDVGDAVGANEKIGEIGDTAVGESEEIEHLHFSVTVDEEYVDPTRYF